MVKELKRTKYLRGHTTDTVLGRTGTTLDWPKSIQDFDPLAWNNYVQRPPIGSDWRDHLMGRLSIAARNAVKPFALYFEHSCNLALISKTLFESAIDWSDTFDATESGKVEFGKKTNEYQFGSLVHKNVLTDLPFSPNNLFSRFESDRLHMHGTRVQRGEEGTDQAPKPLNQSLSFDSVKELRDAWVSLTRLVPQHLELQSESVPKLFSTGIDIFVTEEVAEHISCSPTPGISFPYRPITVDFIPKSKEM